MQHSFIRMHSVYVKDVYRFGPKPIRGVVETRAHERRKYTVILVVIRFDFTKHIVGVCTYVYVSRPGIDRK